MSDQQAPGHSGLPFTTIVTLTVPFFSVVAVCYLFGFWSTFGVNPLEYIGLGDVIRISLYPLTIGLGIAIISNVATQIAGIEKLPPGGGRSDPVAVWVRKHARFLSIFWVVSIVQVIIWVPDPLKWGIAAFMSMMFVPAFANTDLAMNSIENDRMRGAVASVVVLLPLFSVNLGRSNAHRITTGREEHAVVAERIPAALALRSTAQKPILYAGKLGDRIALYETLTKHVVLIREDQLPVLPIREK
jgi:hypothetical protein